MPVWRVPCPSCAAGVKVTDPAAAGTTITCPRCGDPLPVPDPLPAPVVEAPAPPPAPAPHRPAGDDRPFQPRPRPRAGDDPPRPHREEPVGGRWRTPVLVVAGVVLTAAAILWYARSNPARNFRPPAVVTSGHPAAGGLREIEPRFRIQPDFPAAPGTAGAAAPSQVLLTPSGDRLVVGSANTRDPVTQVWEIAEEPQRVTQFPGQPLSLVPGGGAVLLRLKDGHAGVADLTTGKTTAPTGVPARDAFVRSGGAIVVPEVSPLWGEIRPFEMTEYDPATGRELDARVVGRDNRVRLAPPVEDGRVLVYAYPPRNQVRVYDLVDRLPLRELTLSAARRPPSVGPHLRMWEDLRVSQPDGRWVAVSRTAGVPEVFDGRTGEPAADIPVGQGEARVADFVPGRDLLLVVGHLDRRPRQVADIGVFDIRRAGFVAVLRGHDSAVGPVAVSADGRVAATAHQDGSVHVWDLGRVP